MKKSIFIIILIVLASFQTTFGEQYFYTEHKFTRQPIFCGIEMYDPQLPEASKELLGETQMAISDWESKLMEHTNNTEAWKITYKTIPIDEQDNFFNDCDVEIYYEREPENPEKKLKSSGETIYFPGELAEIRIYYLDVVYYETKNEKKVYSSEPVRYINELRQDIAKTIRHEIGHALGLDHVPVPWSELEIMTTSNLVSPSIMVSEEGLPSEGIQYEITPYDIRAVVSLYGESGFPAPEYYVNLGYLIIGIPIAVLSFFVYRIWRKKK